MASKVQVILNDEELAKFKSEALKESKSLSAWLRDAGKMALETKQKKRSLRSTEALKKFFRECNRKEQGKEPDWEEQKQLILQGYRQGKNL